jgi:hypothetical protein
VPKRSRFCRIHDEAIAKARDLAKQLRVAVWLIEDHTHFKRVASYRPERPHNDSAGGSPRGQPPSDVQNGTVAFTRQGDDSEGNRTDCAP